MLLYFAIPLGRSANSRNFPNSTPPFDQVEALEYVVSIHSGDKVVDVKADVSSQDLYVGDINVA